MVEFGQRKKWERVPKARVISSENIVLIKLYSNTNPSSVPQGR